MSVQKLITHNFRNLKSQSLTFHPDLNFILGDNGSGKSSLLEAIFYLGHGKSFRTSKPELLAEYSSNNFVVSIKCDNDLQLGISRNVEQGSTEIKLNGDKLSKLSELALNFAVQVITPESFKLFFGGPKERRRFFDLGMFHVKHQFSHDWRDFSKVLKQRNACLRNPQHRNMLGYWTTEFCRLSNVIAEQRMDYLERLRSELMGWLNLLLPDMGDNINVQYLQGWNQKKDLADVLLLNHERELELGYSTSGAHKFDIRFNIGRNPIENTLSRGQQKLFLLALTFTQTKLIEQVNRVKPILLIDDIGAELDLNSRKNFFDAIEKVDCQVIITAIDKGSLEPREPNNNTLKMFHVKHGMISEVSE